ncbi:helix-turn-helix transcriptional regulator [Nocardioides mangrovi]|uniref:LuxR C-terminal-related transcriptional regulator n=1 Tax=Nocardioides mangrovi TaxID=2874580 RepID=A0ABS7UC68_9ACTN|nr:LuxR C-terminal-related transcriptional regulator [Nocardioides mangrovi]MBZ5738237.1 LuxR C-terminal-related transcriptional regulator [Nocardioides mangrovi]
MARTSGIPASDLPGRAAPAPAAPSPRPPEVLVSRSRLDGFLDGVPDTLVNLVVAPAGSGKTAAAAAWSERVRRSGRQVTVAWTRGDRAAEVEAQLTAHHCPDAGPTIIVIDDVHLLAPEPSRLLADLLASGPEAVRLLLIGRSAPDVVPVSLALSGSVRTLRIDDLRFTDDEAATLVRTHHPDASSDDVAAVIEQADGWAAALVLGARALAGSANAADARAALAATRQPVLDYLLHEVFEGLAPDLATVLLTTCQDAQVTADDAVLLSGNPQAPAVLDQAAAAGLLVTSYREDDGGTTGWRYHPLLLDLLRRRTAPTGPDWPVFVAAHRRATEVYLDRHEAELAVRHAQVVGDLDLQLRVLREFAADLLTRRRADTLAAALGAIPIDVRAEHLDLIVLQATLLRAQGRIDAAKVATDRALEAEATARGPIPRGTAAQLAALKLWLARYGWLESRTAIDRAEAVLGCRHDEEVSAHDLTGIGPLPAAWLTLELSYFQTWLGDHELATIHVQDVTMYAQQVDLPSLSRASLAQRAMLELVAGAYQSALTTAESVLLIPAGSRHDVADARAHLARGWGLFQELRVPEAEAALAAFDATPGELLDPLLICLGRLLRACVLTANGEVEAARRVLDSRGDVPGMLPRFIQRLDQLVRLLIAVTMGDRVAIEAVVLAAREVDAEPEALLAEALLVGLGGDEQRTVRLLTELLPRTVDLTSTIGMAAAVARVAFLHRLGTPASVQSARDQVPELLGRAAPQRLLWMLSLGSMVSPGFTELIAAQAEGPDPHPFAARASETLRGVRRPYPDPVPSRDPSLSAGAEALLTAREREVLGQLALGGGNADLARALFVSENTVKTHLASIYRKLDVDRRVDALRVARARGLI